MIKGIYVATGGMIPRMTQMDNVAHNLANVSTNGYKKTSVFLRQLIGAEYALNHALGLERSPVPEDVRVDFSQGPFEKTDNTFDIALNGSGFLRVRDNMGTVYYTRNGHFQLDPNGLMVNSSGMFLLNRANNVIRINGNDVQIIGNGDILVDGANTVSIGLAEFGPNDYATLQGAGMGLFVKPAATNEILPNPGTQFLQGYLEDANVEPVLTMVDMIQLFREFELCQKAIQIQDQSLQRVVTEVGVLK